MDHPSRRQRHHKGKECEVRKYTFQCDLGNNQSMNSQVFLNLICLYVIYFMKQSVAWAVGRRIL